MSRRSPHDQPRRRRAHGGPAGGRHRTVRGDARVGAPRAVHHRGGHQLGGRSGHGARAGGVLAVLAAGVYDAAGRGRAPRGPRGGRPADGPQAAAPAGPGGFGRTRAEPLRVRGAAAPGAAGQSHPLGEGRPRVLGETRGLRRAVLRAKARGPRPKRRAEREALRALRGHPPCRGSLRRSGAQKRAGVGPPAGGLGGSVHCRRCARGRGRGRPGRGRLERAASRDAVGAAAHG